MAAMSSVALALAAGGTAISAFGQIQSGRAAGRAGKLQRAAADSAAELTDYNAAVADIQAEDALLRGQLDEQRFRGQVRGAVGAQRAGFAGGNIDVSSGSAVDVQADAAYLGELDALTIRTNAKREAWGYKVEATDLRKRAEITRKEGVNLEAAGRQARTAAFIGAGGTVASGTGSLLAARYGFGGRR